MNLELGCGANKKKGFYGIDISNLNGVDLVFDLNKGIPLKDNSVDKVYSSHCIEHIEEPLKIFEEIYRVLKEDGTATIILPHWSSYQSFTFMHKRFFHTNDFCFFEKTHPYHYYTENKFSFKILSVKVNHKSLTPKNVFNRGWNRFFTWLLNINLALSENFLFKIIMANEIVFVLKRDKC